MITYKNCKEVSMDQIFEAFSIGFSDYIIPLKVGRDIFEPHFFGAEGNSLELSYIALDGERPIGLILGGIRIFDGLKTMRCGALCIAPEYRGKGITQRLFEMHKTAAVDAGCKQLFLEVIKGNDRAVKFYEKSGYSPAYTLKYYSSMVDSLKPSSESMPYTIREISFEKLDSFRTSLPYCHINWQSDTPYYAASTSEALLGAYDNDRLISLIAMNIRGKINFLWVEPSYRGKGIGTAMIFRAAEIQGAEKLTICIPSNSFLEGFVRKIGFQKDALEQFEMYLPL